MSRRRGSARLQSVSAGRVTVYALLILGSVVMVLPYVVEILTSLKTYQETVSIPPRFFPASPQWSNYREIISGSFPIAQQILNSVLATVGRVVVQVCLCAMAAYGFARLRFPGRGVLFGIFLSVLMVPSQLFLIPQYQIMQHLGWLDTIQALFVPGAFSAFGVFLLRQFFVTLPIELEEAAKIDGANPWQIFWKIMLPTIRPALAALALLTLVNSWNDLLWPLVVNSSPSKLPISVGLANLVGQYVTPYQLIMAGAVLASVIPIAAFLFGQKSFIKGMVAGAIK